MFETKNILFCGTGGQGVLKASEICGHAAMMSGYHVKKSDLHGMAMRGGSVESHLRFGSVVYSPLIIPGSLDYLVCLDKNEGLKRSAFLRPEGCDFRKYLTDEIIHKESRFLNVYILGILSVKLPFETDCWYNSIKKVVTKNYDENVKAFNDGRNSLTP